jgi:hypothetical protein
MNPTKDTGMPEIKKTLPKRIDAFCFQAPELSEKWGRLYRRSILFYMEILLNDPTEEEFQAAKSLFEQALAWPGHSDGIE